MAFGLIELTFQKQDVLVSCLPQLPGCWDIAWGLDSLHQHGLYVNPRAAEEGYLTTVLWSPQTLRQLCTWEIAITWGFGGSGEGYAPSLEGVAGRFWLELLAVSDVLLAGELLLLPGLRCVRLAATPGS